MKKMIKRDKIFKTAPALAGFFFAKTRQISLWAVSMKQEQSWIANAIDGRKPLTLEHLCYKIA